MRQGLYDVLHPHAVECHSDHIGSQTSFVPPFIEVVYFEVDECTVSAETYRVYKVPNLVIVHPNVSSHCAQEQTTTNLQGLGQPVVKAVPPIQANVVAPLDRDGVFCGDLACVRLVDLQCERPEGD